jgi:tRNA pseudouridine55 synthase
LLKKNKSKEHWNGWLLVDKTVGITSFQAINRLKKLLNVKVGHCGTLDPFASGCLVVALGKATKLIQYAMPFKKNYTFSVKWGVSTDSDDLTGKVIKTSNIIPTKEQILNAIKCFVGKIDQVPPIFSAVKINGKKAYEYARRGEKLVLKAKEVHLLECSLLSHKDHYSTFNIITGKGFYVRSLARDLAISLKTFAHVVELRRNQSHAFQNIEMINAETIKESLHNNQLYDYIYSRILPLDYVLDDIPVHNLDLNNVLKIKNGQTINNQKVLFKNDSVVAIKHDKVLIGLCTYLNGCLKPTKIF